jgi:hypothetical protein
VLTETPRNETKTRVFRDRGRGQNAGWIRAGRGKKSNKTLIF